ncbi:MAG: hypothetical protein WKG01_09270 [Kofleriaceae bacterium]
MTGVTGILIKLGVRLAVFGLVFYMAARRNPKVLIRARWATPLVAFVFALLNTALYWALTPVLNLATLGAFGFLMPLVVNGLLLVGTVKLFHWVFTHKHRAVDPKAVTRKDAPRPWFEIQGLFALLYMAGILTVAHGALWVALDYLPNR